MNHNPGRGEKIISVIMATLLGGMMWRCRGSSGFGSSWGLYCVGFVFMLIIFLFYGNKKGMRYELIPFGAFSLGLGVTGYASVIEQSSGRLESFCEYMGEESYIVDINPKSGLLIFVIMAFTFAPLFPIVVGSCFSEKKYTPKDYILLFIFFFGMSYIFKATIAHPILKAINPEQVEYALKGLQYSGYEYKSPAIAYLCHFAQKSWAEDIPFFENYYMSIEHISDFLAIISTIILIFIRFKDKITALAVLVINSVTCIGSVLCSSMVIYSYSTGYATKFGPKLLSFLSHTDWGVWEYCTGAFVGFATLLFIALLPKKYTVQSRYDLTSPFKNKTMDFVVNILLAVFILALTPARAIGQRIGKVLYYGGILEDYHTVADPLMIILTVILAIGFILMIRKNLLIKGQRPMGTDAVSFSKTSLPSFLTLCLILYLFTNRAPVLFFPYNEITCFGDFASRMLSVNYIDVTLVFISYVICMILYIFSTKKEKIR